jgi:hypothetical protein
MRTRLANASLLKIIAPCPKIIRLVPGLVGEWLILMMSKAFTVRAEWRPQGFDLEECQSGPMERYRGQKRGSIGKTQLDLIALKPVSIKDSSMVIIAQNVYRRILSRVQVATGCHTNKSDGF